MSLEEAGDPLRGRAGDDSAATAVACALQGEANQVAAHALSQEARQRVERGDLGDRQVRVVEQGPDAS